MYYRQLTNTTFSVGAVDWNRRLFDELIPLPDGTSYNAYIVRGSEKTALVDTVDPTMADVLLENIGRLGIDRIDYIIANHAEQDHSGTLPQVMERYPESSIMVTPKGKTLLEDLLRIPGNRILSAEDGTVISLGDRNLELIHTPWVHWPETMVTYNREDRILFSCDFFGSHLATSGLWASAEPAVYEAAKRYYAEIMMPFRTVIRKNMEKIGGLDIAMIAPSHGPVYDNPSSILDAYRDWISDSVRNEVVLPYISMHGSTQHMVNYFIDALVTRGVMVKPFNLVSTDLGELAMALVDAATIVIGSPTVLTGPHPLVVSAAYIANMVRPKARFASIIGSYGWGGKMVEQLSGMLTGLKATFLEPVIAKGLPTEETFRALDRLANEIQEKHGSIMV